MGRRVAASRIRERQVLEPDLRKKKRKETQSLGLGHKFRVEPTAREAGCVP